jgi:hypothetical protein
MNRKELINALEFFNGYANIYYSRSFYDLKELVKEFNIQTVIEDKTWRVDYSVKTLLDYNTFQDCIDICLKYKNEGIVIEVTGFSGNSYNGSREGKEIVFSFVLPDNIISIPDSLATEIRYKLECSIRHKLEQEDEEKFQRRINKRFQQVLNK